MAKTCICSQYAGRFPPETVDKLLNNEPTNIEDAIQLFPHKKPAKEANEQKIDELDGPAYVYRFRDHFRQYAHHDGRDDGLREKMERAKDGTLPGVVSTLVNEHRSCCV